MADDPTPTPPPFMTAKIANAIAGVLGTAFYMVAPPASTWGIVPGATTFEIPIEKAAVMKLLACALVATARAGLIAEVDMVTMLAITAREMDATTLESVNAIISGAMGVTVQHGMNELSAAVAMAEVREAMKTTNDGSN